ncbi:MAG: LacI family DNA-binding transcriptional regulator [Planctomycetota bacterium]
MASVRSVAAKVGVSVATVSRALNNHPHVDEETRQLVIQAAGEVVFISMAAQTNVSTVIGLVYPGEIVRADYGAFESALMIGVLRGLNEMRFDLKIISIQRDKLPGESYSQFLRRKGLRGAILRTFEESRSVAKAIAGENFPFVVVADRFEEPNINYVCCESGDDSRRAVQHLIDLGHRRIALAIHRIPDTDHRDRRQGYERALRENGITIDPSLMLEISGDSAGGSSLVTRLLNMPNPPTGVFLTNPLATVGALRRCLELGVHVPDDLSIVGFDDSDIRRHTYPPFTAVCQDAEMIGFEAARWLSRRMSDPAGSTPSTLQIARQTFFEINRTTGRPPEVPIRVLPDGTRISPAGPQE